MDRTGRMDLHCQIIRKKMKRKSQVLITLLYGGKDIRLLEPYFVICRPCMFHLRKQDFCSIEAFQAEPNNHPPVVLS